MAELAADQSDRDQEASERDPDRVPCPAYQEEAAAEEAAAEEVAEEAAAEGAAEVEQLSGH